MKVTWIHHVGMIGGAERSLLDVTRALQTRAVDLRVLTPTGPLQEALAAAQIPHRGVDAMPLRRPRHLLTAGLALLRMLPTARRLTRAVREAPPDLIHANSTTAALYALPAAMQLNIPLIWHCRDIVPLGRLGRLLAKHASKTVASSATVAHALMRDGCAPEQVQTILNGITTDEFTPLGIEEASRHQLGLPEGIPLVGMVAHHVPWKRHDLFLEAAALIRHALPAAHFVIAGGDPLGIQSGYTQHLQAQATALGLQDAVTWLAPLDIAQMPALYDAIDLLIHPADREPFGRVLCEALCMETPVLSVAAAGAAEIIRPRQDGLLVPPDDAPALALAATSLLSDPAHASRLAQSGRRRVREHFAIDRVADEIHALYHVIVAQRHRRS